MVQAVAASNATMGAWVPKRIERARHGVVTDESIRGVTTRGIGTASGRLQRNSTVAMIVVKIRATGCTRTRVPTIPVNRPSNFVLSSSPSSTT